MSEENNLRAKILFAGAKGDLDFGEAQAMLGVLAGEPILKALPSEEEKSLGRVTIYQTLDTEGKVLVSGQNYSFGDKKVKVLREEISGGNILDTYSRVYYLNEELEEDWTIVEGKYPQGIFNGAVYRSRFQPIKKE